MSVLTRLACLGLLSLVSLTRAEAQNSFDCGNLNQRICQHADWARMNLVVGENRGCEVDLIEADGVCRNDRRNLQKVRRSQWAAWALENQITIIGRDTPINFLAWPAAHQAHANPTQGFPASQSQQSLSITDQLNAGARLVDLDVRAQAAGTAAEALRLCRTDNAADCVHADAKYRLFGYALQEVADWVDANPRQLVVVRLNNAPLQDRQLIALYDEVQRTLGARLYPAPAAPKRWPTPGEMLDAGKPVLVAQFNLPSHVSTTAVWKAAGLGQFSNRVSDQNLEGCIAHDGMDPAQRGRLKPLSWWDVADSASGLLHELTARKAVNCGVAAVGLSQVGAADARLAAMVWSWAEGDWGRNGPAFLNLEGRWNSGPASERYPAACALRREMGSTQQDRAWRITAAAFEMNPPAADAQCMAEFGPNYTFALPENGYQNRALAALAAGRRVWLRHTASELPTLSLRTRKLVFRMTPGGPAPAAQNLEIGATPGTPVHIRVMPGLPLVAPMASTSMPAGMVMLPVSLTSSVTTLPPGVYRGSLQLTNAGLTTPVDVELVVKAAPQLTLTADPPATQLGKEMVLRLDATGALDPRLEYTLHRLSNGALETVSKGVLPPAGSTNAILKLTVSNLPVGTHTLLAATLADARNLPASARPLTVTIHPRLSATPAAVNWQMFSDTALPQQDVSVTGLGASPVVTAGCTWINASLVSSALRLLANEKVKQLPMGTHRCDVTVTDALTAQGLGHLVVPVTLARHHTLTAQPAGELLLVGDASAEATVQLSTSAPAGFDITATSNVPWLQVVPVGTMRAPGAFRIVATGGAQPYSRNRGEVVFRSPVTPEVRIPVLFDRVKPTTVETLPTNQQFTVDGTTYTGSATFYWPLYSVHRLVMLPHSTETERRVPVEWQTATGTTPGATLDLTANAQGGFVSGLYQAWYRVRHVAGPGGRITASSDRPPDGEFYRHGTNLELTAVPELGFANPTWNVDFQLGNVVSNEQRIRLNVFSPTLATVQFQVQARERVEIVANAPGATAAVDGVIMALPVTLYWYPRSTHSIWAADTVQITAQSRHKFTGWPTGTGLIHHLVMPNGPLRIEASYRLEHRVTVSAVPVAGGTVSGDGWYPEGSTATLEATPAAGYRFVRYTDPVESPLPISPLTVTGPLTVTALFDLALVAP